MQLISIELFMLVALLIVSLIDLRYKAVPSIFLTSLLFMSAITNISNLGGAVLLLIFGLMIQDIYQDRILGRADFKAFIIIGFLLPNILSVIIFIMIFLIFQITWAFVVRKIIKTSDKEIPFLIVFFLSYLTFYIVQMYSLI